MSFYFYPSMQRLAKAIAIAAKVFENTLDKGGAPYILHCLFVMDGVRHLGETAMVCGVLHDVPEDFPEEWPFERLAKEGFTPEEIVILQLLTHRAGTTYDDYIKALSVHPIAKAIKKRDIEHNTQVTRLKGLRKKDLDRIEKYFRAYTYLSD